MTRRRIAALFGVVVPLATLAAELRAAKPEDAPPESREQVAAALSALTPAFETGPRLLPRKLAPGAPGTIEHVIGRFAPARFHPVVDGALPPLPVTAKCPAEMALVAGRFCIDRYEAHLLERQADGSLRVHPHNVTPKAGRTYVARSKPAVFPQSYLSGAQAARACSEAGKRLCQPVEWRAACGGSDGFAFPYGPRRIAGACRDRGASPMLRYHAASMKRGWGRKQLNDPRLTVLEDTLAKTGSHAACVNDYGVYDMVGNVHEWTADPNGTFQGGYWLDTEQHGTGCAYRTIAHPFDYHDYSIGFRCCADAGEKLRADLGP